MKVGNNAIQINVIAEDGITNKRYELIVHRRNEQEQLQYEQEKESVAEKLSTILEEQNNGSNVEEIKQDKNRNIICIIGTIVLGSILIIGILYIKKRQKKID